MTRKRIKNILAKEWEVMLADASNTLLVTLLPLLIVAQGTVYIWAAARFGGESLLSNSWLQSALLRLLEASPALAELPALDQIQVLLLTQFNFYLLLIPTMIAINFATFSIVDEKLSGSLEPLLATPVRTWELLLGKALAGVIPALAITWACGAIYAALVVALGWGYLIGQVVTPSYFLVLFLLTPVVATLSFLLGVVGSSRAKDAKSAQNAALLIIFPVLALIGVQLTGLVWFTGLLIFGLSVAVAAIDVLALRIGVNLFQRESIILKWR